MNLNELTAHELSEKLKKGETTSVEVVSSVLKRIKDVDAKINAFLLVDEESAVTQAKKADERIQKKQAGPLTGIPVAVKDNMCIKGQTTTCGSRILFNFKPPYEAAVVEKLRSEGAVIIGKTNMDEFAMGSSTENSAFKKTSNPCDLNCIPGGSSGGSAAAVSADETILALGSDTGGSIRQPAACCGVVGMKPTYGRVSRFGLVAFASSLDQIGPFAKDVRDCAALLNAISGPDNRDSTSATEPVPDYTSHLDGNLKNVKIGLPEEYFIEGIDPDVRKAVDSAVQVMEKSGAKIVKVSLPMTQYCLAVYYIIAPAEASSNLARYDGVHYGYRTQKSENIIEMYMKTRQEGFGAEVKRRIMLGTYVLSSGYYEAYYKRALKVRTLIREDFKKAFEKADVLVTPTSPTPAFRLGEKTSDPLQMYLSDIFTVSLNLAGLPGISIPCGFKGNLPVGLQITGKPFDEAAVLKTAYAYEQAAGWHMKRRQESR